MSVFHSKPGVQPLLSLCMQQRDCSPEVTLDKSRNQMSRIEMEREIKRETEREMGDRKKEVGGKRRKSEQVGKCLKGKEKLTGT